MPSVTFRDPYTLGGTTYQPGQTAVVTDDVARGLIISRVAVFTPKPDPTYDGRLRASSLVLGGKVLTTAADGTLLGDGAVLARPAREFEKGYGAWTISKAGTGAIGFTAVSGALKATVATDSTDRAALVRTITPSKAVTVEGWWRCTTVGLVGTSNVPAFRMYVGAQRLADLYRLNSNSVLWLRTNKAASGFNFTTTGVSSAIGEWVYLSIKYVPSAGVAVVRVNDVKVIDTIITDRFAATNVDNLSLGSIEPGNSGEWEARDIRITLAAS